MSITIASSTSSEELESWVLKPERANLEFKAARNQFSNADLYDYCAALANEGGGKLLLGVSNERKIVGTEAFRDTDQKLSITIFNALGIRVDVEEQLHRDGRVLIFHVPTRLRGQLIQSRGKYRYPMRLGESLVEMDEQTIRKIVNELEPDFTAEVAPSVELKDLSVEALFHFKKLWSEKSQRQDFLQMNDVEMLRNLDLLNDRGITYAAIILLGKEQTLRNTLPDAEIIVEWRQMLGKTAYDARREWRSAFVLSLDEIWQFFKERNLRFPLQQGFVQLDIWAFAEKPIREAVLNSVAHRDYRLKGRSVFITASPESICFESPGGFPSGINSENILEKHVWRNRLLMESLNRIGLVERSGQGLNDIFEMTIRSGKGSPSIVDVDGIEVRLSLPTAVKDIEFVRFLERVSNAAQIVLTPAEVLALEEIRTSGKVHSPPFRERFLKFGLIEQVGRGRGAKYVLSHRYYAAGSQLVVHTRLTGISREERKTLILKHLQRHEKVTLSELIPAFPELKRSDVVNLLQELRRDGLIEFHGKKRAGFWVLSNKTIS